MTRRAWYLAINGLVALWLILAAVAVGLHRFLPAGGWLMVHLLLLGAVSTAILIWSQHFADTILRHPARGGRLSLGIRLGALSVGAAIVVAGMVGEWWVLVLAGGLLVAATALAHGTSLALQLRGSLPARFAPLARYYVAASLALVVGVTLGVVMARPDVAGVLHDRLFVAHIGLNVLGWIGLTVVGTIVLLWPTVLRTKAQDSTDSAARLALPLLAAGLVLLLIGCLVDLRAAVPVGILIYLAGLGRILVEVVRHARASAPVSYAGWSIGAALGWLALCALGLGVFVATAPTWSDASQRLGILVPVFAVGFAAQVVLGALSYLLPVVLGGGPEAARASARELDRVGLLRVILINGGIVLYLLPVPSLVKVALAGVVFVALAAFLVLAVRAVVVGRRVRTRPDAGAASLGKERMTPAVPPRRSGMVISAVGILVVALAVGVALDPAAVGLGAAQPGVAATGHTTTVDVKMVDTRFVPDTVKVPAGDKLVINLTNADDMLHDLVLESGATSGLVNPGASAIVDVGVVGADLDGWCSIAGHRLLGMVFTVDAVGTAPAAAGHAGHAAHEADPDAPSAAEDLNLMATPPAGFVARDAVLAPAASATLHTLTLTAKDTETEVAPGVTQTLWTYNGTAPGPTLRGKVGDVFEITLKNDGTIGHSIDFHAGALAPDQPMRTINPGESLTYRFTATRSGIWLYHCSTMPMSVHIANGMFGAVIIDPPGLSPVEKEYVLVQSEYYLGPQRGEVDAARVPTQSPDLVTFNGYANQYRDRPLTAVAGEKVRVWVLDAGPNVASSFHVVGGQFDTVFQEGEYRLRDGGSTGTGGAQVLGLMPAQGGFVELTFPEAGDYPFVSHVMSDAEKGATGLFRVAAH